MRITSIVSRPLLRNPSTITRSWLGIVETSWSQLGSWCKCVIRAILSGATIMVSELPACMWRYESFPGMSMSKPLCPWCLIVPMSYPHSTSFATICSMSVVLPELWRPTKLIAGLSLSKHVVLWEVYATIVRVLELIAGAKICKQLRKHAYACTYWYCIVAWAICVVHRIIFCVT
ncbi:Uncharacterised protein [Chlamydia trachomatis]|nr:Uncharacterised protein [Chlamydia trachomatis]